MASPEGAIFARKGIFARRAINIGRASEESGPITQRGTLPPNVNTLEVHESAMVDRNNGHIVVKLSGEGSRKFGKSEPVILYERNPRTA
ncbi:MAG: hypothetical protein ACM3IJ_01575 [Candidatus Levyibacteriota bacterium]